MIHTDAQLSISATCSRFPFSDLDNQDIRVTRGPCTLKGGVSSLTLYVENRNLYKTMDVKKGMLLGQLILTDIQDSKKYYEANVVNENNDKVQPKKENVNL